MESDIVHKEDFVVRKFISNSFSINTAIIDASWRKIIKNTTREASKVSYWGSRFLAYHIARLEGNIDHLDKLKLRSCFIRLTIGSRKSNNNQVEESFNLWTNKIQNIPETGNISGMNAVVNSLYSEYYVNFTNYHKYAILNHYSWLLRLKYDTSKYWSVTAAKHIFKKCGFALSPKVMDEMKEEGEVIGEGMLSLIDNEVKFIKSIIDSPKKLNQLVRFHYLIAQQLSTYGDAPQVAMAPLSSPPRRSSIC